MGKTYVSALMQTNEGEDIQIEGYVHFRIEEKYGEDADGNYGEKRIIVEDVTEVTAMDWLEEEVKLTEEEKKMAMEILSTKFLEE